MEKNENIEIKRMLDILKSKKIIMISILVIFMLLGYFYSYHYVIPKYKSITTLLLIPNSDSESRAITNSDLTLNSGLITTYCNLVTNSKVLKQAIEQLEWNITEQELLEQMQVKVIKNTYIIEIAVTNSNAQKAMEITKEIANVFLEEIKQIYNLDNIGVIDEAQLPEQPYNINHIKDIVFFLAIGILVCLIYMVTIYLFDNTIKKEEEIENYIHLKSLGSIPFYNDKKQEIIERGNAKSYITECINTIRTNILYMNATQKAKTILITSCTPREGKSWVSANMASSFAETEQKVLLIDADMRKGRAHKIFNVKNEEGLSNYLYEITGEVERDIELAPKYIKETDIPNLHILTNGMIPPNPSELIDSSNMKELIAILKNIYDIIIIDAPPCKLVTDSAILSTIVDSTVLVVNSENTKMKDLNEVRKSIETVGGKLIGAILNKKKISGKTYSKSYYYGHREHTKEEKTDKKEMSVKEVIDEAMPDLQAKKFNVFSQEKQEKKEQQEEKTERLQKQENTNTNNLEEFINIKLEQLQQKNSSALKEEIKNLNHTKELQQILKQLEEVKANYKDIIMQIEQNNLTNEQMKELVKQEFINLEKKESEKLIKKQIEYIVEQEITKNNYKEQIIEINEMLGDLKDSYLELSNRMKANDIEKEKIDNKKIIDFTSFKKQKNKKSYSIDEDIFYHDLEKTASYIIPIQTRRVSNSSVESYESAMW